MNTTRVANVLALFLSATTLHGQVPQLINYQGRVAVGGMNFDSATAGRDGQFKFALIDGGTNTSSQAFAVPTVTDQFVTSITVTEGGSGYQPDPPPGVTIMSATGTGAIAQAMVTAGSVSAINVIDAGSGYADGDTVLIDPPPPIVIHQRYWSNDGSGTSGSEPTNAVSLTVTKGLYSVLLGDTALPNMTVVPTTVFTHPAVFLRVWFDDGIHGFQQLTPDQRIAAVGYAMMAGEAQTVPDGAITASKIAAGAVQASNIASGAVGSSQLAAGAVQASNIAPGTITSSHLAKPPQAGSIASSSLQHDYFQRAFTVSFSPAFTNTPIITLGWQGFVPDGLLPALWVESSDAASFTGRFSPLFGFHTLDSTGFVGEYTSLAMVDGNPAISYYAGSAGDLRFVRATDANGTEWGVPLTIDSSGTVGQFTTLAVVNGNPAISYYDITNHDLKFIRATNTSGTAWGAPVTLDSTGDVGKYPSLVIVNGNPAISYCDYTNYDLRFVRATDASGTTWGAPIILDSAGNVGFESSLAVVNGNPAISYRGAGIGLKFVRANNASGTTWAAPVTLDGNGTTGYTTSLAVIDGNPAISYMSVTNQALKFIRATDASGTVWAPPLTLDVNGAIGIGAPDATSLAVVNGKPAVSYYDYIGKDLMFIQATDASGTTWETPAIVFSTGDIGRSSSLAVVNGTPAISYHDNTNHELKFVRAPDLSPFTIQWIALEP